MDLTKISRLTMGFALCLSFIHPVAADNQTDSIAAFATLDAIQHVAVSSDGKKLATMRATSRNGDYVIEIRNTDDLAGKSVTLGADKMIIAGFQWLNNEKLGVSFRQLLKDGAKKRWVSKYAIVRADGEGNWLVPFQDDAYASFTLLNTLAEEENEILLEYDVNNNYIPDVVKFNIDSGRFRTIMRGNTERSGGFISDFEGEIRGATGYNAKENALEIFARATVESDWIKIRTISPKERETFDLLSFSKEDKNKVYVRANNGQDKAGIYLYDMVKKEFSEQLFGMESVDAGNVILSNKKSNLGKLLGFTYTAKSPSYYFTDPNEHTLYNSIESLFDGKSVTMLSRSQDDNQIVIRTSSDKDPGTYYLLSEKKSLQLIGETSPQINPDSLASVKYISYEARDGRKIHAYVTIPKGNKPYPTVVLPHGGPWARDAQVFDEWSQVLASHGYLVIQPQFRGSEGYGLDHWIAGDREWGLKMQDDLDDAANFLVKKGLADQSRLAMFGWSYGGYAAFVASMRENNIYKCSIAGAGVSDLDRISATLNESRFLRELQRPTITGISPIEQVEKVNIPLLVIHGDIDKIVPVEHSQLFVEELKRLGKDHKYVEIEDLGHKSFMFNYEQTELFYTELINWLQNKCFQN